MVIMRPCQGLDPGSIPGVRSNRHVAQLAELRIPNPAVYSSTLYVPANGKFLIMVVKQFLFVPGHG